MTHTPGQMCLNCGEKIDGNFDTKAEGRTPQVGDIAVCLYCAHVMEYGVGLVLQQPSDAAIISMAGDKNLLRVMRLVDLFHKKHPKG